MFARFCPIIRLNDIRTWPLAAILALAAAFVLVACGSGASGSYSVPGLSAVLPESPLVKSARGEFLMLPGAKGPDGESPRPQETPADWREYGSGESSRIAILLTDPDSAWLGLAHGMKSFGIPFMITDSLDRALEHRVVLAYPGLDKASLDSSGFARLERHVAEGGAVLSTILARPSPDLAGLFGFRASNRNRRRFELSYADSSFADVFIYPEERTIRLGNPISSRWRFRSLAFLDPGEVLASYNDGKAAIVRRESGRGCAIAFGFDLGLYIKRAHGNRDGEANRSYVNGFEPSVDTLLRFLGQIYRRYEPDALTLHPAPDGYPLSVIVSHDVDYAGSLANSVLYAEYERSMGYGATYFLQTKYFRDFFDEVFFDERTPDLMARLESLGMELASHSVSHSDMFARLPQGSYRESYPEYQPRIIEFFYTRNATIMGELRVSKYLIERYSRSTVASFRPGFLANPFSLPESLESAGYRYSSAVTANDVMTHLPYRQAFNRLYASQTMTYEFPITVEDEKDPPMDGRVDAAVALAEKLSSYGGLFMILIHPNVTDDKLRFLKEFTERVRDKAWWGTLAEFGAWWEARDRVEFDVVYRDGARFLRLSSPLAINGLGLKLADGEALGPGVIAAKPAGKLTVLDLPAGVHELPLIRSAASPALSEALPGD
jgi:peptidoglycan/xylan/chitin deacetylase (PgdA/CDA1 family)